MREHSPIPDHHGQQFHPDRVKFRQITPTPAIRIPKTTHFQQAENSQVRQTRTTPHAEASVKWGSSTPFGFLT